MINHFDLIQKLADQDSDLRQKAEDSKEREQNLEQQLSAESAANQELQVSSLILLNCSLHSAIATTPDKTVETVPSIL